MLRSFFVFIAISILISACALAPQATPQPDQPTTTSSPLPTATPTRTALPTATPTASITPLPTIPAFTPTFDVSTIVTVTPAPKAECPKEDPSIKMDFQFPKSINDLQRSEDERMNLILEFLNEGGSISLVLQELDSSTVLPHYFLYQDVTGDNIKDLLIIDNSLLSSQFRIFYCDKGGYKMFTEIGSTDVFPVGVLEIQDLNQDGLPEIILEYSASGGCDCWEFVVEEWNGSTFGNIAIDKENFGYLSIEGLKKFEVKDINNDGFLELILTGDRPAPGGEYASLPWRFMTIIYSWNGKNYSETYRFFEPPQYLFQAIQDGDRETVYKHFDLAMKAYRTAITNSKLEWWSKERKEYEVKIFYDFYNPITPTPLPSPIPDLTEYPRLAAYAYYRIMLIHLVQGYESEASTTYNTLQQTFGNDPYGHPYVEMATAFWEAYQSTHKMYDGCAAAIEYAAEHPDILIPLGSDYHGWQSHQYKPEDVCPFR